MLNKFLPKGKLHLLHSGIAELIIVQAQHIAKYGTQKNKPVLQCDETERR